MNYREQLLDYLEHEDITKILDWINTKPILDHADIFRELQQILREIYEETNDPAMLEQVKYYDTFIPDYEEKVLDEKLAEANYVMALQEQEKAMQEMEETVAGVRRYIINCIINKEDNAEAMKELAQKVIASEKENGVYDEDNWKEILNNDEL